jgi:hypothetical protein
MSATLLATSAIPNKKIRIACWVLQILAAAAFIASGSAKLAGVPMMVAIFDQIGIGQWFRIVTGLVEITGAIALLVPAIAGLGGLLLATTMAFGVLTHLLVIGGNPGPAIVLLLITGTVAYLRRASLSTLLGGR